MRIDCCLLALVLALANIITLAIFAGYTVKLRDRQFELEKQSAFIQKKNGAEQKEINQLKAQVAKLENLAGKSYTLHSVKKYKEKKAHE